MFLTSRKTTKLRNSINNNTATDIKLSKAQIKKVTMSGTGLKSMLGRLLPKLIKPATSLLTNVGLPLGLSTAMSGIDKKIHGYGSKTVKFSNDEINDMTKVIKALEDSDVLMKGVTKTFKNDVQNGGALPLIPMLLGTLCSLLSGRGMYRAGMYRAGKGMYRIGQELQKKSLIPFKSLKNFEIQEYYKNKPRFNGVYSKDNLPKTIKNGAYVINLDEYEDVGTHWIALFVKNDEVIYFDSFGVEHVPKKIIKKIYWK